MNNRRKLVIALGTGALVAPFGAFAQQQGKAYRIGFFSPGSASAYTSSVEALRAGLRDLGYVEGKNLVMDFRWADGKYERLAELAAELVRLKVDVIVTHATPGTRAAKQATTTIPIVMALSGDVLANHVVSSLAHPDANITGTTFFLPEFGAKRLELLKEAVPRLKRAAFFYNVDNSAKEVYFQAMKLTARSLKVDLDAFFVRKSEEFESAFSAMTAKRIEGIILIEDPLLVANAKAIADLANKWRLPSIGLNEIVEAGGLMAYGVNFPMMFRRAAYFVDRILKGAKPGDIPIEQPTSFELVVNMKTAKALGIKIPNSILVRAERVIE
jgi:putative ABC transport system substrate-binding protein